MNEYIYTSSDSGATWNQRTQPGVDSRYDIACSADGLKIMTGGLGGYMWTSTDGGVNWTQRAASMGNYRVCSSADGVKLATAPNTAGYIWTSTNSGANWTQQTGSPSNQYWGIACSADGTKMVAAIGATSAVSIWTSTDSGVNWTQQTNLAARNYWFPCSSADGTKLAAVNQGGYIYTSTDSGVNWTERTGAGSRGWQGLACDSTGMRLVANDGGGNPWTSIDGGVNWTQQTTAGGGSARVWYKPASSSDGSKIAAVYNTGYINTAFDPTLVIVTASGSVSTGMMVNLGSLGVRA